MSRLIPILVSGVVVALAAPTARADEPLRLSANRDNRKLTREECARKAVEAMAVKAKFPYAEVTADGNARGWNANTAVLVLSYPTLDPERVMIMVIASGVAEETERVCAIVKDHVFDGPIDPKTPARVIPGDGKVPPAPCALCWKAEEKPAIGLLKLFDQAAMICLEKLGYNASTGIGITLGAGPSNRAMVVFLAPTGQSHTVRLNVVSATPRLETGEKLTTDLLLKLGKLLYE